MGTMWRKTNKWNEDIRVGDDTCGSCIHYQFDDERYDNPCTAYYRKFHYHTEPKCGRYECFEKSSVGCFITTACCEFHGLPDDCEELKTLRKYRDEVLVKGEKGKQAVKIYYKLAPLIVKKISEFERDKQEYIYTIVYQQIKKTIVFIREGAYKEAYNSYMVMTCLLYIVAETGNDEILICMID